MSKESTKEDKKKAKPKKEEEKKDKKKKPKKQKRPPKEKRRKWSVTVTSDDFVNLKTEFTPLTQPTLLELKQLLLSKNTGLSKYFKNIVIEIIEPNKINFSKTFNFSSKNIGGSEILIDVGSVKYLKDRSLNKDTLPGYAITDIIRKLDKKHFDTVNKDVYMFGNAFGSSNVVKNSELIIDWNSNINHKNIKSIEYNKKIIQNIKEPKNDDDKEEKKKDDDNPISPKSEASEIQQEIFKIQHYPSNEIGCQGNLFVSEGKDTRLLLIECEGRLTDKNYGSAIQEVLQNYGKKEEKKIIGLGGLVEIINAGVDGYLMTNYNDKKKLTGEAGGLVMYSTILSNDFKGYELNTNHSNFLNEKKSQGGQYINDTNAKNVKYRGYFNIAKYLYIIENPKQKKRNKK